MHTGRKNKCLHHVMDDARALLDVRGGREAETLTSTQGFIGPELDVSFQEYCGLYCQAGY